MTRAWQAFWFAPRPTSTLALFRIALGLTATAWTATLAPDLFAFFAADGIRTVPESSWGLLALSRDRTYLAAVYVVTLVAAVALTVGWRTRAAAVVAFVGMASFLRGNGLVTNSGDVLLCDLVGFCALAPAGAALSLDRRRTAPDRFWEFPERAPWALRLVQVQLSVLYLSAFWQKVQGETWREGTAISYAVRLDDVRRFGIPALVTDSPIAVEILTFGTLALELSLGILVWNRVLRPWVLALGVVLHLGIEAALAVGFFGAAVLIAYLAFTPPETAVRLVLGLRDRVHRRREPVQLPRPRPSPHPRTPAPARPD